MAAIHNKALSNMRDNITTLNRRMLSLIDFSMTHDQCIKLIAPAEHIQLLYNAAKYANIDASQDWMTLTVPGIIDGEINPRVRIIMCTRGLISPPLMPRVVAWQPFTPGEVPVLNWLQARLEAGRKPALTRWVLDELAEICDTGAQIRYLWPAVLQLGLRRGNEFDEHVERWIDRNAPYKAVKSAPYIKPALRAAIRETSGWLTSAALIEKEVFQMPGQVAIDLYDRQSFDFHGVRLMRE